MTRMTEEATDAALAEPWPMPQPVQFAEPEPEPAVSPSIAQAVERLKHVDRGIWEDVESALRNALEGHHDAELDELDCTLLLDLLWLYRNAEPLLTGKADEIAAERENRERLHAELNAARQQIEHLTRLALRAKNATAGR